MDYINQIICADVLDALDEIKTCSVDLTITSPPYADKRKKSYGGIPPEKYVEWFLPISDEIYRVTNPHGSFILNIKEGVTEGQRQLYVYELVIALRKQGWAWVDEFMWNKTNPFPTGSKTRLKDGFERCYHFTKTDKYQFFPGKVLTKSTSKYAGTNEKRKNKGAFTTTNGSGMAMSQRIVGDMVRPSNVLTFPSSCINIGHPAAFPLELPDFFIRLLSKPGDIILDPFVGSGTTAIAAQKLGRRFVGIDNVQKYVDIANKRLELLKKAAAMGTASSE